MAATIKALNAKIRANKYLDYFCSTHFWGPASNFGIPAAAVMDISRKDPDVISGKMTTALVVYSAVFMRYSLAVTPKNYLLFGCHFVNECAQLCQAYRYVNYWHNGGHEAKTLQQASAPLEKGIEKGVDAAKSVADKAVQKVGGK